MRLYCHCLNINIDVLQTHDDQETLKQFVPVDLVQFVNISHEWYVCDVPSEQSVHIVWQSLLQTIPVRDMKLNRCLGCNLYTHVTNIGPSRMLINKDMLNEATVRSVYRDPNYSKIAKIVLPNTMNSTNMTRLSGSQDDGIQRECDLAQQAFRQSIEDVERETEEKIRMYQREQEEFLETKRESLNKELDTFLSLMRSAPRHPYNTKGSPTLQSSSSYINENSTESGFGSDIFDVGATDLGRHSSTNERAFSERHANIDDETNDDPMLDNQGWYIDNNSTSTFATSVAKDITFRPSNTYAIPHQDDDSDDLERIGKSFRDLSKSMCTDGTELFGDLPSPRLNARRT
ncbi:unnamed protein product [Adineta steineri]|uniref:Uncharacterized protein n=1 Tax=Adineta steineri TaxID=433720 RepID=A0A814MS60_9BILA|nr:unnamed protein product [Adineta steineri]CAF3838450.1 unnamed protein product [Adineta steineri]